MSQESHEYDVPDLAWKWESLELLERDDLTLRNSSVSDVILSTNGPGAGCAALVCAI